MKSLIVSLLLLVYPQVSFAAVDAWRMNQFTGKPDYYQTGVDSTTVEAIAVSTSALAVQTAALSISTAANAARITSLEVSTASLDSTLSAEIQVRQALSTQVAIDTTTIANNSVLLNAYNEFTSSNSFASIIVASGTHGAGDALTAAGTGSRFFFYPRKSAIRAGYVAGDQWDDANIGVYSTALGLSSIASGQYSSVVGGSGNSATANNASVLGCTASNATADTAIILGGDNNNNGGSLSAIVGGNYNTVNGSQSGILAGGSSNVSGNFSAALGGLHLTVSGVNSLAGGNQVSNAADYSFAFGNYVGLSSAADGSMIFGYDTSSVKTYTEPNKFYIHGLDLRVSSSTTAAVQYGLTKEGAATVDTLISKSTATLAALSVTGQGNITGPINISTATITGYIDVGVVTISSSCVAPLNVATTCDAVCPSGYYLMTGFATTDGGPKLYQLYEPTPGTYRVGCYGPAGTFVAYAKCGRIK